MSKYRPYKRIKIIRPASEEGEDGVVVGLVDCPKFGKRIADRACFPLFCSDCVARGKSQVFCGYGVEVYSHDKTRTT